MAVRNGVTNSHRQGILYKYYKRRPEIGHQAPNLKVGAFFMKSDAEYIEAEAYSAIMNYDPAKERADQLATELLVREKRIEFLKQDIKFWEDSATFWSQSCDEWREEVKFWKKKYIKLENSLKDMLNSL